MRAHDHLVAGVLALEVLIAGACIRQASASHRNARLSPETQADQAGLFSPDPQDISNRLYRQIRVRTSKNGKEYGFDEVDPLLWAQTKYLLSGPSHSQVLRLLDEFSRTPPEQQLRDPVKKAILAASSGPSSIGQPRPLNPITSTAGNKSTVAASSPRGLHR
jgi:hypothetical protein